MNAPVSLMDLDSHEMIPLRMWNDEFEGIGDVVEPLMTPGSPIRHFVDFDVDDDEGPVDPDKIWVQKGPSAPGAINIDRRVDAMDAMGVDRQLLFPNMGSLGAIMATAPLASQEFLLGVKYPDGFDYVELGREMLARYNDWVVRHMKDIGGARIRPVGIIIPDDLDEAVSETERMVANGCRAICMPSSNPPAGFSPGDPALDPLWRTIAESNVPFVLHLAMDWGFMRHSVWGRIPAFARTSQSMYDSHEFPGPDPYWGATEHMGNENWLTSMLLGGVFERFPTLRMGVIENGAFWVGPLADRLDMWTEVFPTTSSRTMSLKPSEYLARNVRVTPLYFEPVAQYFERWPHLHDVYSFSTDYPHPEGGKYSAQRYFDQLEHLGTDVVEKFFRANGELLLPA